MFQAITEYLSAKDSEVFQFENVAALAAKPLGKGTKQPVGPSNLTAVDYKLRQIGMWTHVWVLDSRHDFGSGQQRTRLWGHGFRLKDLFMDLEAAHSALDDIMNEISGVPQCDPEEYLLPDSADEVRAQRASAVRQALPETDHVGEGDYISSLFGTGGAALLGPKRRKLRKVDSEASSPAVGKKWPVKHAEAFRLRGEDTCIASLSLYIILYYTILYIVHI